MTQASRAYTLSANGIPLTLPSLLPLSLLPPFPQAFITALELPCLSTSFETFRHVRDRLLALHLQQHQQQQPTHLGLYPAHAGAGPGPGLGPGPEPEHEHQRRISCLNTLLYLRGQCNE